MAAYPKVSRRVSVFALVAILASLPALAHAGLIEADTANAMTGFFGNKDVQFTEASGKNIDGSVDYAVYAPGKFDLSFPGQDPSGGSQYVYRYQLHNKPSPASTDYIRKLTVALVGITDSTGWYCKAVEPGPIYPSGGTVEPTFQVQLTGSPYTSAVWAFRSSAPVNTGSDSKMLIFTSPYAPTYQLATILSQSSTDKWEGQLPSPVPEPASFFGLLGFGLFFLGYRVWLRK
jgi:hypothetical protein